MIVLALIKTIVSTLSFILGFIPALFGIDYIVTSLPWGLDTLVSTGFGYVHYMATILPPVGILLTAFGYYVTFRLILMLLKLVPYIGRLFR